MELRGRGRGEGARLSAPAPRTDSVKRRPKRWSTTSIARCSDKPCWWRRSADRLKTDSCSPSSRCAAKATLASNTSSCRKDGTAPSPGGEPRPSRRVRATSLGDHHFARSPIAGDTNLHHLYTSLTEVRDRRLADRAVRARGGDPGAVDALRAPADAALGRLYDQMVGPQARAAGIFWRRNTGIVSGCQELESRRVTHRAAGRPPRLPRRPWRSPRLATTAWTFPMRRAEPRRPRSGHHVPGAAGRAAAPRPARGCGRQAR